jgi:transcription antitermination factor NusA-like protein
LWDLLCGEKIDIVKYSDVPEEFIAAALAPAKVITVEVDESTEKSCKVTVPDNQLFSCNRQQGSERSPCRKAYGVED